MGLREGLTPCVRHSSNFPQKGGADPEPTYYQYVNMDLVTNVEGTDFAGGVLVGMQDTNNNVEKVVEKLENAVKASGLSFGKVEAVGRALVLEQGAVGFAGNTQWICRALPMHVPRNVAKRCVVTLVRFVVMV